MHTIDWLIIVAYLAYVLVDGVRRAKGTHELDGYFLAHRSLPWWAVGLSVMATQLSAVTLIGTTGQGATDGMRFVQFYFGLPLAMVILGVTLVPFLHGARVFTAYEYLERRFDAKTRTLTSVLFLLARGMSCGTIIAAPAVILSALFGWKLIWSVAAMGVPTVIYTMIGGVQAVTWVDVKQMVLIVLALVAVVVVLLTQLPVNPGDALHLAGAAARLRVFDFSFNPNETYTFWSGVLGGTFLMLSYFGTDQSQVQRYITARSVNEARSSLLMSAYWKIPLQALVLLVGVLVFVFYVFRTPPLYFNPVEARAVQTSDPATYEELHARYAQALDDRASVARAVAAARSAGDQAAAARGLAAFKARNADVAAVRDEALTAAARATGKSSEDVNFVMPWFVLHSLPVGLVGVFIAAVLAAAMSSIAAELNSLASVSVIDLYRRWVRPQGSDAHYLMISKVATGFWGLFACVVATFAATLGSLIEVVNRYGSFFYGSILGVFLLAMVPRARATGAFVGLIVGMGAVAAMAFGAPSVSYLWHNVVGAVTVVGLGMLLSVGLPARRVRNRA
jgi:SSS family solute:Na+ symporter